MKALTQDSVVGTALQDIFCRLAETLAAASRGAMSADEVSLTVAPAHTGSDLAFQCFKMARAWKMNPAQIAQEIAKSLADEPLLSSCEAAGPYLNLRLNRSTIATRVLSEITEHGDDYGHSQRQGDEVVMVEYVSPNTNKPLHLGHLRNAVLGRAVARLTASQGAKVWKTDIINDRGIHIAKSMLAYQRWGGDDTPQSVGVKGDHYVGQLYVRYERELQQEKRAWMAAEEIDLSTLDDDARKKAEERFNAASEQLGATRELLQRWEANDPDVRLLWRTMNQWVFDGFDETYTKLGITFDKHYYESEIYQGGKKIIQQALDKGIFKNAPNGAVMAPLSEHGKLQDKAVLRADGTGLYITQDINLATIKFAEFGLTRSLYCIATEQNYYMQQLFATLDLLGFEWAANMIHLSYGMVYLPEGKMKSREGNVVDADTLMEELSTLAAEALRERYPDLADDEIARRAPVIGLAAMNFHFLVVGKDTDIQFDPKQSIAFEGKTGPYLQYSYARVASMLRKAEGSWQAPETPVLEEDLEWQLAMQMMLFPSVVADSAESYDPSRLANYLVELVQTFGTFYHDHRVLDAEEPTRSNRLALVSAFQTVVRNGLGLLSIDVLEEM